jgi:hypothetical protein
VLLPDLSQLLERVLPTFLEVVRHQTIGRIDFVEAPLVFRVTLFQEHFFMIKAGAVTMIPGRRGERDVFGG